MVDDVVCVLPLSIIMGDINGLKMVNDSFGHSIGDEILKRAAKIVQSLCGNEDICCRLGGDEYVIILPNTDSKKAQDVIHTIISLAANIKVANIELSISLGLIQRRKKKRISLR